MQLDRSSMTSWQSRFKLPPEPEHAKHMHGRLQNAVETVLHASRGFAPLCR